MRILVFLCVAAFLAIVPTVGASATTMTEPAACVSWSLAPSVRVDPVACATIVIDDATAILGGPS